MKIFILTKNPYKEKELSKYFRNIGLHTEHIVKINRSELKKQKIDYLCVSEQTNLLNKKNEKAKLEDFEEVVHNSEVTLEIFKEGQKTVKKFYGYVEGYVFPNLKSNRPDIFNWDDIFVASATMKSYQEMKDTGLKNSARDLAFVQLIDYLPEVFKFEKKINLNFNPMEHEEVISFKPFIKDLFDSNQYYSIAYKNPVFRNIINHVLNDGLFIRRATNRKQKNYWLPGLNAGIPLTPKKDALHELTFMFHDIMHFIFSDLIVTDQSEKTRHKYIIARMMSEAFTLVLADMLFISLLKKEGIEYDYDKRKIYPIFGQNEFDITIENIDKIKELLWANTAFALLGDEKPFKAIIKDENVLANYKSKYQRFFQEDYRWTAHNYQNIKQYSQRDEKWLKHIQNTCGDIVYDAKESYPDFELDSSLEVQVKTIFDEFFSKLAQIMQKPSNYNPELAFTNAVKKYVAGQMNVFFKFDAFYSSLFLEQISLILKKEILDEKDLKNIKNLYNAYIDKLVKDSFTTSYEGDNYKNIYPIFEPFYVFYEKTVEETFDQTVKKIFKDSE
jgi:inosine/xanthosine triphosphate pyrophosphatase family protein